MFTERIISMTWMTGLKESIPGPDLPGSFLIIYFLWDKFLVWTRGRDIVFFFISFHLLYQFCLWSHLFSYIENPSRQLSFGNIKYSLFVYFLLSLA